MPKHCCKSRRSALLLEGRAVPKIARGKASKRGQRPQGSRKTVPHHTVARTCSVAEQLRNPSSSHGNQCVERPGIAKFLVIGMEEPGAKAEQLRSAFPDPTRIDLLFQQCRPAIFESCEIGAVDASWQEMLGRRSKSRLSCDNAPVQFLQSLPPPGELDGSKRWLRRACNHVPHHGINLKERLERGLYIVRQLPKHQRTVGADCRGQFLVSDNRRP
jgi:hypothetical protein